MSQNSGGDADRAREALSELQTGLDGARRLVERTRFLLVGEPLSEPAPIPAEPQAASPATSDTVQKPSGE